MILDREYYTSHIHNKDKIFAMRKLLDKIEIVLENHYSQATDFLDPYERLLGQSILNRFSEIKYIQEGGPLDAERKSIIIYPDYLDSVQIGDHICGIRITGTISQLKHKDYLGALLGLGFTRNKMGDIFTNDSYTDIVVKAEIASFVLLNLDKIGNERVKAEPIALEKISKKEENFKGISSTLTSLRLDVYISSVYNLSRSDSMKIIKSERVKVNHEPIDKTTKELKEGDLVSVKGFGRALLYSLNGLTKKNRIKANIRIFI